MTEAFPLAWPAGWPRTPDADRRDGRSSFKRPGARYRIPWTFVAARDALLEEVWRHQQGAVVLSTNFQPGRNGPQAHDGRRRPDDQAVAVYFQRYGKPYVIACDRYADAEGNMRSLTLALEALRQLERHGGGVMLERAFQGFAALPAPRSAHEVLGISVDATRDEIQSAWRSAARKAHPDLGGSSELAAEINAAKDKMLKDLRP